MRRLSHGVSTKNAFLFVCLFFFINKGAVQRDFRSPVLSSIEIFLIFVKNLLSANEIYFIGKGKHCLQL